MSGSMSAKHLGEGAPAMLAEVETMGLRTASQSPCENLSCVMRIPMLPSLPKRLEHRRKIFAGHAKFVRIETDIPMNLEVFRDQ